jgi:hypothetical protein
MATERDDALTSVHCPQCHAVTAVPAAPVPPLTDSNESELDRMRSKGPEPGDTNGMFNACPECGMFWSGVAASLKDVARDEPSPDAKHGRKERGSKRKSGIASD